MNLCKQAQHSSSGDSAYTANVALQAELPMILPLPFLAAPESDVGGRRGEGRGEGSRCVVCPTVPSLLH